VVCCLQLEKAQPKLKLPSFPHKIQMLNFDVDGQKRKKALSDYVSFVGSHPQLSADATLVDVLHNSVIAFSIRFICEALLCFSHPGIVQLPNPPIVLHVNVIEAMSIATTKSGTTAHKRMP
jgi:hypothetical protein